MQLNFSKPKIGTCDQCDKTSIEVWTLHGNILMCKECKEEEEHKLAQHEAAKVLIEQSREIDSQIHLKQDIYLAKTVPAIELRGAIEANQDIKAEDKEYAFANESMLRYRKLKEVLSAKRQEVIDIENEMDMWRRNAQTSAGKLRAELRAHFRELDITYEPKPITKKQKTTTPTKKPTLTSNKAKAALYEAAKKYGVPVPGLMALKLSRPGKTDDEVAKELAEMIKN